MPDQSPTPDTIAAMAQAAGVALDANAAARVARTVAPLAARLAQGDIAVPFEVEPASYVAVARQGRGR